MAEDAGRHAGDDEADDDGASSDQPPRRSPRLAGASSYARAWNSVSSVRVLNPQLPASRRWGPGRIRCPSRRRSPSRRWRRPVRRRVEPGGLAWWQRKAHGRSFGHARASSRGRLTLTVLASHLSLRSICRTLLRPQSRAVPPAQHLQPVGVRVPARRRPSGCADPLAWRFLVAHGCLPARPRAGGRAFPPGDATEEVVVHDSANLTQPRDRYVSEAEGLLLTRWAARQRAIERIRQRVPSLVSTR